MDPTWQDLIAGKPGALEALYRAHGEALLRYGRQFAQADAVQDAVHDLFVRLWDKHNSLNPAANPRPYLLISLRNDLLRTIKKSQRTGELSEAPEDESASMEAELVAEEENQVQAQSLQQAMAQLSSRERELVDLRFAQNLDYDAIVEVTGISYQSARNTLARAIGKLRNHLAFIFFLLALGTNSKLITYLCEPFCLSCS